MWSRPLICLLGLLSTPAWAADSFVETRFGMVGVSNNTLTFRGKAIEPKVAGNSGLSVATAKVCQIGEADLVLVTDIGGTLCPARFRVAMFTRESVTVSEPFGNCSEVIEGRLSGDSLILTQPSLERSDVSDVYRLTPASGMAVSHICH